MNQCPFLSCAEEKVLCFKECAFYEYETSDQGCPFKKIKEYKTISVKEILSVDLDNNNEVDYFTVNFIKEYL